MSNSIRESLRRRIDGGGSRGQSPQVRYVGFQEGRQKSDGLRTRTPTRRTKGTVGPSGSYYKFRQQGGGQESQWVSVHSQQDLAMFEEAEEFEVRESPH